MLEFIAIGLVGAAAVSALLGISTHNRLMALDERCTTAFSDIDAMLKHRANLIPELVNTVKGYVAQERNAIEAVTMARNEAIRAATTEMRLKAEENVSWTLNNLVSMTDKIPQLTTSPHFVALRNELIDTGNSITAARRYYNISVDEHNATLRQFPANMIGRRLNLARRQQYDLGVERILVDGPVDFSFS